MGKYEREPIKQAEKVDRKLYKRFLIKQTISDAKSSKKSFKKGSSLIKDALKD